jgi:hypothetical protein
MVAVGAMRIVASAWRGAVHGFVERLDEHSDPVDGARFDPNTPFVNAQLVARLLGNAVLLTHDGYGHVRISDPSACVNRAMDTYFVDRIAPRKGTVCCADRLPFDPQHGQPVAGGTTA